jgi:hypothetical protein
MMYRQLCAFFCLLVFSSYAEAQPQPPVNPQSAQECESFRSAYKTYLDGLQDSYRKCFHVNESEPVTRWQSGFRCDKGINVPSACMAQSNTWSCASEPYGRLVNQCLSEARANHNRSSSRLNETFEKVKTGLGEGAKELPGNLTKRAAEALAEWWNDHPDSRTRSRLLDAAREADKHVNLANDIAAVFNKNNTPAERLAALTEVFNRSGHAISEEFTRASIKGVTAAGSIAIDQVSKSITQFPSSHASAISRAQMQHRLAVARERAAGAESANRANLDELNSTWRREIDENIRAAEEELRALAEEQARIAREHEQRMAEWRRQQAHAQMMEQQRRYNEYANWAQATNSFISGYLANARNARTVGRSYGPAPVYRPPPRPIGGGSGTNCPAGMVCTMR